MRKRIFASLLTLAMVLIMIPVQAVSVQAQNDDYITPDYDWLLNANSGQIDSALKMCILKTAGDLQGFANIVNRKSADGNDLPKEVTESMEKIGLKSTFAGWTVYIKNDIALYGTWTPIDGYPNCFAGTLNGEKDDGEGAVIAGLKLNDSIAKYLGFFARTASCTIKNITIGGETDSPSIVGGKKTCAGALVGCILNNSDGENGTSLDNITIINANISGCLTAGGMVGNIQTSENTVNINRCYTLKSKITGTEHYGSAAAGLVAQITGTEDSYNVIYDCTVENTTIDGYENAGGLLCDAVADVVECKSYDITIENCKNAGGLLCNAFGGVANCLVENITINNCINENGLVYTATGNVVDCTINKNTTMHLGGTTVTFTDAQGTFSDGNLSVPSGNTKIILKNGKEIAEYDNELDVYEDGSISVPGDTNLKIANIPFTFPSEGGTISNVGEALETCPY